MNAGMKAEMKAGMKAEMKAETKAETNTDIRANMRADMQAIKEESVREQSRLEEGLGKLEIEHILRVRTDALTNAPAPGSVEEGDRASRPQLVTEVTGNIGLLPGLLYTEVSALLVFPVNRRLSAQFKILIFDIPSLTAVSLTP